MKKPNFIIVGAPKAGTTSIANYLSQHPDIFISKEKEPFYFLPDILKETSKSDPMYESIEKKAHLDRESYYGLFEESNSEHKLGEATVHYLYHYKEVIPRIKQELGDISIIIILRNPVERAFSNYKYQSRGQIVSFEKALELEEERKLKGYNSFWFYKEVGLYYLPVKSYLENFSNVKVCFFEDFKDHPVRFMQDLYQFLDVDNSFTPDITVQHNITMVPKNKLLHFLFFVKHRLGIKKIFPKRMRAKMAESLFKKNNEKLSPDTYRKLQQFYKEDIVKLEELLGKDLSKWYKNTPEG